MKKTSRIIVLAFAISALLVVFVGGRVWGAGEGGVIGPPGPGEVGGGGSTVGEDNCSQQKRWEYMETCSGWSWIKYDYVGPAGLKVDTPMFGNWGTRAPSDQPHAVAGDQYYVEMGYDGGGRYDMKIPSSCMVSGGSFWHAGLNGYMYKPTKVSNGWSWEPSLFSAISRESFSGGFHAIGANAIYNGSWGYTGGDGEWGHWRSANAVDVENHRYYRDHIEYTYHGTTYTSVNDNRGRTVTGYTVGSNSHVIWYNNGGTWTPVWRSSRIAPSTSDSELASNYRIAFRYQNHDIWDGSSVTGNFWFFCYWPGMEGKNKLKVKANFELYEPSNEANNNQKDSTGWDASSTGNKTLQLPYAKNTVGGKITYTAGREDVDGGFGFSTNASLTYQTKMDSGSWRTYTPVYGGGNTQASTIAFSANSSSDLSLGSRIYNASTDTDQFYPSGFTINPGATRTICTRVLHKEFVDGSGTESGNSVGPTACMNVQRESWNQTKTATSIKAYEASSTSNKSEKASGDDGQQTATDLTIDSPNYKIDVTHVAKRSLPSGGGNTNWAINNLSLTYSGGLSGDSSVSWAANNTSDKTIMNKTYSGTLAPGESKTLCFSVSHKINIYSFNKTAAHGDGKSQVCITIKRKEAVNKVGANLQLKTTYTDVSGNSQTSSKDSGWDSDKTNYVASETAGEVTTTARTFTVEVTTGSKAKRTGSPIDWELSAPMTYQYSLDGGSTWSTLASNSGTTPMGTYLKSPITWSTNNNNQMNLGNRSVSSTTLGINNLLPGNSVNFCVRVTHKVTFKYKHVTSGNPVTSSDDGKAQVCQKVTRINRKATYSGSVTATASDSDTSVTSTTDNPGSSQTITVSGNDYKIKYKHVIERTDSAGFSKIDDGTDPLKDLANSWNTTISPTSKPYDANALGEAKSDSVKTPSKKTYTVREYEYSGKIYAGQKITYCETLKYESAINESGTVDGTATKKACIIVKKNAATCSTTLKGADFEGYTYTYNNGKNLGQIGVKNATLGNNYTYTGLTNTAVSIWARPGDDIRFEYNHCAAGLYPYVVHNGTTGTTYTPSGSSDGAATTTLSNNYLFGEQMSTWDGTKSVAKPQNYNVTIDNLLSTTLHGTKYSPGDNDHYNDCLVASGGGPVKGYYKVTGSGVATSCDNRTKTLDVGHTFQQKYVWTNLGYDNGTRFNSGTLSAQASVSVPYNYVLNPYIKNPNTTAILGGTITMNPGVVVAARKNTVISKASAQTYATITKPTSIKVTYFYTDPTGANQKGSGGTLLDSSNVRLNNDGDLNGTGTTERLGKTVENGGATLSSSNNFVIPVDDNTVDVGDRVCMKLVVSPADSVDNPGLASVTDSQIGVAMQETGSSSNTRTIVSCSTVAKRPTMSVESSNAYSATKYETSNYVKSLNGGNYRFGSWSEYGVFGNVNATSPNSPIFASGAALGYSTAGYKTTGGSWTQEANIARNNNSSTEVATKENSSVCTYMTQTFANDDCKSATSKIGSISAEQFRNRMTERYGSGSTNVSVPSGQTIDLSGYSNPNVIDESGAIVMRVNGNAKVSSLPNIPNSAFEARGITSRNRTIVYSMKGKTLTITGNLNEQTGNMTSLDDVTGVVIIAGTVNIDSSVTYINATIIADEVNTCKTHNGKTVMFNGATNDNQVSLSSSICNTTLRFDGPVVTKKIILNRTAGAGKAANSIKRGEIFNLSMADYLWSFNQMSRYNQAVTTYSRELPPRY